MILFGSFFCGGLGRGSLFRRSGCFCSLCEQRSSAEADPFAGRKVNGCPTTDGFDGPCRDRGQLPRPKAHEAHLVPLGDFFADSVRQGVQHRIGLFQIHMGPGLRSDGRVPLCQRFWESLNLLWASFCRSFPCVLQGMEACRPVALLLQQRTEHRALDHSLFFF